MAGVALNRCDFRASEWLARGRWRDSPLAGAEVLELAKAWRKGKVFFLEGVNALGGREFTLACEIYGSEFFIREAIGKFVPHFNVLEPLAKRLNCNRIAFRASRAAMRHLAERHNFKPVAGTSDEYAKGLENGPF